MTNCALLWLFKQIVRWLLYPSCLCSNAPPSLILNFTSFQAFRKCLISSSISTLQFPLGKCYFTANKCLFQSFLVGTRKLQPSATISRLCSNKDVLKLLMTPTSGGRQEENICRQIVAIIILYHNYTVHWWTYIKAIFYIFYDGRNTIYQLVSNNAVR